MTVENSMSDLLKDFDVKKISSGDILSGEVIDVNDKEVVMNINYAFDGLIAREELTVADESPLDLVSKGDKFDVYVLSPNDGDGYVKLSKIRAQQINEKKELQNAFKNNETIVVKVKDEIKGGLIAYYGSIRVFIPGSLASRERIVLKELVGKDLEVRLTEFDLRNRKVVGSRRVIEEEAYEVTKKELWKTVKNGEKRDGIVKKVIKAGAIVDIGGITGLIHINDLAWGRVKRVEDVVNVGDKVTVFVGNVDVEHERVSLILKDSEQEPWKVYGETIKVGDVLEGKVTRMLGFGAFVELFPGIEGLVHINEITDENIAKPDEVLKSGQLVKVKVLDVKKEEKRISLSIKDAVERSTEYMQYNDEEEGTSLGDLFKGFFEN